MLTGLLCFALDIFTWGILLWVVASWVPAAEGHPIRSLKDTLDRVFNPMLRPIRGLLPPVRLGGVGLDLSPLALMIAFLLAQRIIC